MLVGYARVSRDQQDLAFQQVALQQAGCEKILTDKISGSRMDRPGLTETLSHVRFLKKNRCVICICRLGNKNLVWEREIRSTKF
jgi:DNA invertase Pin-like site-specific DNA recombinase